MIADTHAHLTWDSFEPDLKEVIERAKNAGVQYIINVGPDLESSKAAAELECSGVKCFSTIGLHPEEISKFDSDEKIAQGIAELKKIYLDHKEKVVAIGECGLDYYFNTQFSTQPLTEEIKIKQKKLFQAQIDLAKELNLPLIIHNRDSWDDIFLPSLQEIKGVFHSFIGTKEQAEKVLDMGFYLSFSGMITYPKNEELREILKAIPLDKILTETDCPFLPPQALRGQRNEPANVSEVVKTIAEVKNLSFDEVAYQTLLNAKNLFHLE